jgi:hypothetical protein
MNPTIDMTCHKPIDWRAMLTALEMFQRTIHGIPEDTLVEIRIKNVSERGSNTVAISSP